MVTTSVDGKSAADPSVLARLRDWDIHDSSKHPYRRLATNVYQTRDGKWFHLHGSLDAEPSQKMIGVDPSRIDITDTAQIVALYQEHVAKFDASELDTLANDKYRQAGTTCYTYEGVLYLSGQSVHFKLICSQSFWSWIRGRPFRIFRYMSCLPPRAVFTQSANGLPLPPTKLSQASKSSRSPEL